MSVPSVLRAAREVQILLVDDEEVVLRPLLKLLQHLGYRVQCASNGAEALQYLERQPVDLVISDIRMPGIDGLQLARTVRERNPDIPVVLVGGYIDEETAKRAEEEKVRHLLPKPLDFEKLLEVIEEMAAGTGV